MSVAPTFKSIEHAGWNERAGVYDDITAIITNAGIVPLLDAADIAPGQKVLDVCCGTGLVAASALERGATVKAIDIAEDMIAAARAKALPVDFCVGDAEALSFPDASFDRVICNFGLFHVPEPDKAIAEAARVLRPGGRYAFTTWCGPEGSALFTIIPDAIKQYGRLDVGIPPAPPPFRLADRSESERVMRALGFADVGFADITAVLEWPLADIMEFVEKGLVRATMLLAAQAPQDRPRIVEEIQHRFAAFANDGIVRVPLPALVVGGTKV